MAHRLTTIRNADVIFAVDAGRVVEFGSHDDLMTKQGVYYNLVVTQEARAKKDSNNNEEDDDDDDVDIKKDSDNRLQTPAATDKKILCKTSNTIIYVAYCFEVNV